MKLLKIMFPVIVVTLIADQLTKVYAMEMLSEESITVIPNFFSLSLAFNRGAAFGFLSGLPDGLRQFTLGVAALFALSAVLYILVRYHRESIIGCISVGLVIGGALGNIIDRVRLGAVVDFLDVYWGEMHWPTFNVADSCVCVGVAVLIFLKTNPAIDEQPVAAA